MLLQFTLGTRHKHRQAEIKAMQPVTVSADASRPGSKAQQQASKGLALA
jgi:hypothetical protein